MGRRQRRRIKFYKRKLPDVFHCPNCGQQALKGAMEPEDKDTVIFTGVCGNCKLEDKFPMKRGAWDKIDGVARLFDRFYLGILR